MRRQVKIAMVDYIKNFLDSIVDDGNTVISRMNERDYTDKLVVVTGRLIDRVPEMLAKWRESNGQINSPLPVMIVGFDRSYQSSDLDKGISISEQEYYVQDNGNFFKLRIDKHEAHAQMILISPDDETSFSIASQFKLYCENFNNRVANYINEYNGVSYKFPMKLQSHNIFAPYREIEGVKNLTALIFDIVFDCSTPYFLGTADAAYFDKVSTINLKATSDLGSQEFFDTVVQ